mmetsp:Transcript_168155/g.540148  ORF Transcript_168155/g.540148 Transcript_168155/m.540148 type:complete len:389 (+) Transcript_168155:26-1192(+)
MVVSGVGDLLSGASALKTLRAEDFTVLREAVVALQCISASSDNAEVASLASKVFAATRSFEAVGHQVLEVATGVLYGLLSDLAAAAICTLRKVKEGRPEKQILAALDALRLTCHCIQLRRDAQSDIENIVMKLTRFFSSRVEVERKLQPHINAALLRTMILVSGEGANFWSEATVRFAFETFVTTCDMPDILLDDASQLALLSSVSYLVRTSENEDALPVLVDLAALHQEALWPALLRALSLTSARVTSVVLLNVFSNQARVRFRPPASIYQRLAQLSGMSPPDGNGQGGRPRRSWSGSESLRASSGCVGPLRCWPQRRGLDENQTSMALDSSPGRAELGGDTQSSGSGARGGAGQAIHLQRLIKRVGVFARSCFGITRGSQKKWLDR